MELGYMGLGLRGTQLGDYVCVIDTCDFHILLRKDTAETRYGTSVPGILYKVVGSACRLQ